MTLWKSVFWLPRSQETADATLQPRFRNGYRPTGRGATPYAADELRGLGTHQVVYLRAGRREGKWLIVLYEADGVPLVMVDDVETAVEVAVEHDLKIIAVH